jgi:hypothetical protein
VNDVAKLLDRHAIEKDFELDEVRAHVFGFFKVKTSKYRRNLLDRPERRRHNTIYVEVDRRLLNSSLLNAQRVD